MSHIKTAEACAHKIRYISRGEARQYLQSKSRGGTLEVYRCRGCGYYHLGHKVRRRGPR